MKRPAQLFAAVLFLFSAQSALADNCFYEEHAATVKTFGFSNVGKDFTEVAANRLAVTAAAQPKGLARSTLTATLTCFSDGDNAPTILQKLEAYFDVRANEYKVRKTAL